MQIYNEKIALIFISSIIFLQQLKKMKNVDFFNKRR